MAWKHIYLTAIIMLGSCLPAHAQVKVKDNVDTGIITASGHLNGYEETNIISIDVKDDNGDVVHTSYIPTNDGNFEYSFKLPDVSEDYVLTFSSYGDKEDVLYTSISSIDADNVIDGINGIVIDENSSNDENNVVTILENNLNVFSLNSYFWNEAFSEEEKNSVADAILQNKGVGYSSLDEMRTVVKTEYAVSAFAICKTPENVEIAFDTFEDIYEIDKNTAKYTEFNKLADTKKEILNTIVSNEIKNTSSIETLQDIYDIVDRGMLLVLVNNATDPLTIKNLIDNNRADITFSLTVYDSGNKDIICPYLFGKNIYSMADLDRLIKAAVEITPAPSTPEGGGNVGGGGGGGAGSISADSSTNINVPLYPSAQEPIIVNSFVDMSGSEWAIEAVNYLADKKIINGIGNNEFAPKDKVTREQFIQMLVLAFDLDGEGDISFSDVPKEHWAYSAISKAVHNGITTGIGNAMFGTGVAITRQDMAVMASKAVASKGYKLNNKNAVTFNDENDIAAYAKDSVKILSEAGIINGLGDNTFGPYGVATRAQAAQIIYAMLQEVE